MSSNMTAKLRSVSNQREKRQLLRERLTSLLFRRQLAHGLASTARVFKKNIRRCIGNRISRAQSHIVQRGSAVAVAFRNREISWRMAICNLRRALFVVMQLPFATKRAMLRPQRRVLIGTQSEAFLSYIGPKSCPRGG